MPVSFSQIRELRQKRAKLIYEARDLLPAPGEGELSAEAREKVEKLHDRADELGQEIEVFERQFEAEEELARSEEVRAGKGDPGDPDSAPNTEGDGPPSEAHAKRSRQARDAWYRYGMSGVGRELRGHLPTGSLNNEEGRMLRALTGGADVGGGVFLPKEKPKALVEAQREFGSLRRTRAEKMVTSHGRTIPVTTTNSSELYGYRVGEGRKVRAAAENEFGEVQIGAYLYSSGTIKAHIDLLADSEFQLESYLLRNMGERVERITNRESTVGKRTSGPQGLADLVKEGKRSASATEIQWQELVEFEHSVDAAYRTHGEAMLSDTAFGKLKVMKDNHDRPLWLPGVEFRAPDRIFGYPYSINNEMEFAPGKPAILFGDFRTVVVRDVVPQMVVRLSEKYMEEGHVGFLLFARFDCVHLNAGTHPIKSLVLKK